jgi:peptidoglycan/LPS O-acetylase OafA/YrhL
MEALKIVSPATAQPHFSDVFARGTRNSLNVLRLTFALAVVVSHAFPLSGRPEPRIGDTTLGTVAVYGFFVISGFLITRSRRTRPGGGRYLWHRFLRIYPGYWVCLIVTGLGFATISYAHEHGSLAGWSPAAGLHYVAANATIKIRQWNVGSTLVHVPYPIAWDGSLWTLIYEVGCYLAVFVLGAGRALRRPVVLVIFGLLTVVELVAPERVDRLHVPHGLILLSDAVPLGLAFAAGALIYMFADRVPVRGDLAAGSTVVTLLGLALLDHAVWLTALPMAYCILWLGVRLPLRGMFDTMDISYGVYIYAFPVQQIFADFGVERHAVALYILVVLPPILALAYLSRRFIELPAERLKRWSPALLDPGRGTHRRRRGRRAGGPELQTAEQAAPRRSSSGERSEPRADREPAHSRVPR